jgi:GH25 family lysozyme M1 (1,4-beta-N-acetylmuramidase)
MNPCPPQSPQHQRSQRRLFKEENMSMDKPVFMIDVHPQYQPELDFERAAKEGYEGVLVKTSQGSKYVPDGFTSYFRRARKAMDVSGVYHFLDGSATGKAQADHFLSTVDKVGGPDGKIIAVDFENETPPPTNRILRDFIEALRRHIPKRPVLVYSNKSFWNGGTPSGRLSSYGENLIAWDSAYLEEQEHDHPMRYYREVANVPRIWRKSNLSVPWSEKWGSVRPLMWQFTSSGLVGGRYHLDVNAFRGDRRRLKTLAGT